MPEVKDIKRIPIEEFIRYIWDKKYKFDGEASYDDTKRRCANTVAASEPDPEVWAQRFFDLMTYFAPGGRIINCLGTNRRRLSPFNCFVSSKIDDDLTSIFEQVKQAAITMQAGGGVGFNFGTLRPKGAEVKGVGSNSSGVISFMRVFESMCLTISSSGARRGAMIGIMPITHPEIQDFIVAKRGNENVALKMFNLSVAITDDFMLAVKENRDWGLTFPGSKQITLRARELWDLILLNTYDYAEPGVLFIDQINRMNNLATIGEVLYATNPCGEQPLPYNGACNLGSVNLVSFIKSPFENPTFDFETFESSVSTAVRFLDNVLDVAQLPLESQAAEVKSKRRIGLGITGLGDTFWMMGMQYGDQRSMDFSRKLASTMRNAAYRASALLAKEKGAFPLFDCEKYLAGEFVKQLPDDIKDLIRQYGIRNSHLLSIAPTGTTSLLWGNISSGIEPIIQLTAIREIKEADEKIINVEIDDHAYSIWKSLYGDKIPDVKITEQVTAKQHIDVMAVWQEYFDASISKTIAFDTNVSFEEFKNTYTYAYEKGLKGCTVYRPNEKIDAVIKPKESGYLSPVKLPDSRTKISEMIETPEGKMYVDITVVDGKPREIWAVTPVEAERPDDIDAVCRLASIALRCNVDPNEIAKQINRSVKKYGHVSSMLAFIERGIRRGLAKITPVAETLIKGAACPVCGGTIVRGEGCTKCTSCDWNRCGD